MIPKIETVKNSAEYINKDKNTILARVDGVSSVSLEVSASSEEISASSQEMSASTEEVAAVSQALSTIFLYLICLAVVHILPGILNHPRKHCHDIRLPETLPVLPAPEYLPNNL